MSRPTSRPFDDELLPHLPPDLHVLAVSQRGHGDSDKPASGYQPADAGTMPGFGRPSEMRAFYREQQAMQDLIESAQFVEYADAGHAVHWEEPQRFARDLHDFAASVAASALAV